LGDAVGKRGFTLGVECIAARHCRGVVADMHAFFAAPDWLKKDEIAARRSARR